MVHVDPAAWRTELAARPDLAGEPLIEQWAARGWPLVVRRRCPRDRLGRLALGLPLPPALGKRRVAVDLPLSAIRAVNPPPALAAITAPAPWRGTVDALLRHDTDGVTTRVFGSFAFAALTGLAYLTPASDLDLLWPLTADTPALLAKVIAVEADAPGRIDGEVVGTAGAVNWRELADGAEEVLVKTLDGVALVGRRAFVATAPLAVTRAR